MSDPVNASVGSMTQLRAHQVMQGITATAVAFAGVLRVFLSAIEASQPGSGSSRRFVRRYCS